MARTKVASAGGRLWMVLDLRQAGRGAQAQCIKSDRCMRPSLVLPLAHDSKY